MALADYYICDCCGNGKTFYDARVEWESQHTLDMRAICEACSKQYRVAIVRKDTGAELKDAPPYSGIVHLRLVQPMPESSTTVTVAAPPRSDT